MKIIDKLKSMITAEDIFFILDCCCTDLGKRAAEFKFCSNHCPNRVEEFEFCAENCDCAALFTEWANGEVAE